MQKEFKNLNKTRRRIIELKDAESTQQNFLNEICKKIVKIWWQFRQMLNFFFIHKQSKITPIEIILLALGM